MSGKFVKKQPVFPASMQLGSVPIKIFCITVLLFTLGACASGDDTGSSGVSGDVPDSKILPESKILAVGGMLWKTDGTATGTVRVQDSNTAISFAYGFTEFNDAFYFQADDNVNGFELWKTDGTDIGTLLVKDINPAAGVATFHYRFTDFTVYNDALYFQANDGVNGFELWKTDGTAAGTVMVKDINAATGAGSFPTDFTVYNGALYFSAADDANGAKLWKTDGNAAGTVMVKDIIIATGTSFLPDDFSRGFPVFNGALYFTAQGGGFWKTDGTTTGTVPVEDINTVIGWLSANLYNGFAVFNGALYVPADDGVIGRELWKTDGTSAGTVLVKDINTENGGRRSDYLFNEFNVLDGALYFQSRDNVNGSRIWKSDGTAAGTVLVMDIGNGSHAFGSSVFNGALYFTAQGGLWKTDGTADGTVLLQSIL
ncbi:MAG: ELWxxDGT repeat protein [Sulfuricaulis sp.]